MGLHIDAAEHASDGPEAWQQRTYPGVMRIVSTHAEGRLPAAGRAQQAAAVAAREGARRQQQPSIRVTSCTATKAPLSKSFQMRCCRHTHMH